MSKPIIGISVDSLPDPEEPRTRGKLTLNWNYTQAVADAGGVPLLIPPQADPEAIAPLLDGFLIPGGNDIDASNWGEDNHPTVKTIRPERFNSEKALFHALASEVPVFGICYGCQFLNVMRGGSLIQHLPDVVGHGADAGGALQRYSVDENTKLAEAIGGTCVEGQSWHHQAVGRLGSGLKVVAHNADGTVEAVEATDRRWLVGVQWHPERTTDDEATQRLFRSFVSAAAAYRSKRT